MGVFVYVYGWVLEYLQQYALCMGESHWLDFAASAEQIVSMNQKTRTGIDLVFGLAASIRW